MNNRQLFINFHKALCTKLNKITSSDITTALKDFSYKEQLYEYFFDNYEALNENDIYFLVKKLKEFNLKEDKKDLTTFMRNILEVSDKITKDDLILDLCFLFGILSLHDTPFNIKYSFTTFVQNRINNFKPSNIKLLFLFFHSNWDIIQKPVDGTNLLMEKVLEIEKTYPEKLSIDKVLDNIQMSLAIIIFLKFTENDLNHDNCISLLKLTHDELLSFKNSNEQDLVNIFQNDENSLNILKSIYSNSRNYLEKNDNSIDASDNQKQEKIKQIESLLNIIKELQVKIGLKPDKVYQRYLDSLNMSDEEKRKKFL